MDKKMNTKKCREFVINDLINFGETDIGNIEFERDGYIWKYDYNGKNALVRCYNGDNKWKMVLTKRNNQWELVSIRSTLSFYDCSEYD